MEGAKIHLALLLFFTLSSIIPTLTANIAKLDEYWEKRFEEANKNALDSYHPNPDNITSHFNNLVHRALEESGALNYGNHTRRDLGTKKYRGPCKATNPIDRCWRCHSNWAKNRKRLADCVIGFGRRTTGGKNGPIYIVTDSSDSDMVNPKPGTLRHAVIQKGPLWIIFARSMFIRLNQELIMQGDKTIDGRGAQVHIAYGAGITIQGVRNVIIHDLHIHDIVPGSGGMIRDSVDHYGLRTQSDGDGISVFGSSDVWIDHVSMKRCSDGIIDVVQGSTGITISNGHFTDHNEVMLFGASDGYSLDQRMQVTVAFNHFGKRLIQRMPRCRWGFFHLVNNDYTHWQMYAIGGSKNPTIVSQGNRFIAPPDIKLKEVTKREYSPEPVWKSWSWRSEGDLMMNGAFFVQSGDPNGPKKYGAKYPGNMVKAAPGTAVTWITRFTGALNCKVGKKC